ncbi:Cof-type HAD-IIB family hydrolase [Bacillus sp. REN16]|uniref:Cof-type HAD-IIB family hydrolase n=1 Tax=Bacillus sp. REN16 TaxID=2887296 RepID=UPI001E505B68|nr:Cof-type HAD-IIB family hydrolase [Bacillus sp. REN16]MCC3355520.1 Cof-type HAD-IIB family hydrolase [Bacillus sp. REN16]
MSKYRLLALDLDGTTLLDNKTISNASKYWIEKAKDKGVVVSFATGRGVQNTGDYRTQLGLSSPMVLLNGADIWKSPEELIERHFIDKKDIEKLYHLANETNSLFWGYSPDSLTRKQEWTPEMFDRRWMKFGFSNQEMAVIEDMKAVITKWGNLEVTQSGSNNLEISIKGITKEYGIRKVCTMLDIGMDQVMAIGDSYNDMKLIKSAGLGVVMGNANNHLKEVAACTTDTNENDGVAKAICQHIFEMEYFWK